MASSAPSNNAPLLTADGTPLKVSLQRSLRRSKLRAIGLVAPPLLFLLALFIIPIGDLLTRSTDDTRINYQLPLTFALLKDWDRQELPNEAIYEALFRDLGTVNKYLIENNYADTVDPTDPAWKVAIPQKGPYREAMLEIAPDWQSPKRWLPLQKMAIEASKATGTDVEIRTAKIKAEFEICKKITPLDNATCSNLYRELLKWDGKTDPDEKLFKALFKDFSYADKYLLGKSSTRMNYEKPGFKSLLKVSGRKLKKINEGPYKEAMIKADERWGDIAFWHAMVTMQSPQTSVYYLNSVDRKWDENGNVVMQPEERRVYVMLWKRTLWLSLIVTIGCLVLAYPVSHLLATLPLKYSNLLMICVLMPFWTSLLVRIVAWMVMLRQEGVVNDTLVALGWPDDSRLELMYNFTGTVIVMIQILLPFMILPIYSVMKTIPPSLMRAAQNLGAPPSLAFLRVYMPQTLPGVGAGVILVFIVAIGYYITPELVGGKDGQLIGNMVAYHMQKSLNWGLAAAMGAILLVAILILYWIYDKVVGIDNMKLG
jgi:putative spermidine/putrescine transport system permease protein